MRLRKEVLEQIIEQARREQPNEACGYLLGRGEEISVNHPMTNADHSPEHFSFVPQEQFAAVRAAREQGLKIIGNWHSHPATPARPSDEDIRLAYDENITYFILSLAADEPVLNAFSIRQGRAEKLSYDIR